MKRSGYSTASTNNSTKQKEKHRSQLKGEEQERRNYEKEE